MNVSSVIVRVAPAGVPDGVRRLEELAGVEVPAVPVEAAEATSESEPIEDPVYTATSGSKS